MVLGLTGCATTPSPETSGRPPSSGNGQVITAAASINAWGSLLSQLGGMHVHASSIISNPATDPHDYEPTPADGRTIAGSALFVGIFAPMAGALGLKLMTPPSFLKAISEGTDPTAADKVTVDAQITGKQIKVYVFNSQNSTPDVSRQVEEAKKAGIPVIAVTETLSPAEASFQDWQTTQLQAVQTALAQARGT